MLMRCDRERGRGDAVMGASMGTLRDATLYSLLSDAFTGATNDELATKRGKAFFDALPRDRPWPPETATDTDCEGAAPASTMLAAAAPASKNRVGDASTNRTATTHRNAARKAGSVQAALQPREKDK